MSHRLIVLMLWTCCGAAAVLGQEQTEADAAKPEQTEPAKPDESKVVKSEESRPAAPEAYTKALGRAAEERKYLFVLFVKDDCPECDRFEEYTFESPAHEDWWNWYAVGVKLNMSDPAVAELAEKMSVETIPTMVFLTNKGNVLGRAVGTDGYMRFALHRKAAIQGKQITSDVVFAPWEGEDVVVAAMKRADRKFLSGDLDAAYRLYSWALDHNVARSASFNGQYLERLITQMVRLGKYYPPALEKIERAIAEAEKNLLGCRSMKAFDLNVIKFGYSALGREEEIVAFYDKLKATLPNSAQLAAFAQIIYEPLLNARRYKDLRYSVSDPEELSHFMFEVGRGVHKPPEVRKLLSCRYEVLLGLGEDERAAEVAKELLRFDDSPASYLALAQAGYRTGRHLRETVQYARRANILYAGKNPRAVMTLARVLAESEKTRDEAIALLRRTIKMSNSERVKEELDACLGEVLTDPDAVSSRQPPAQGPDQE
jgi:tetratricopeptide (TPR) repeat protein